MDALVSNINTLLTETDPFVSVRSVSMLDAKLSIILWSGFSLIGADFTLLKLNKYDPYRDKLRDQAWRVQPPWVSTLGKVPQEGESRGGIYRF